MYRGRHEHQISKTTALTRLASTVFRRPVMGPRELFYADIFASRETPCRSQLGLPGIRDQHAGCVGAYLVEHDLFDFLLLSLPDNDTHSHRHGPHAQVTSIAAADRQLERLFHAGGGTDALPRRARGDRRRRPLARARGEGHRPAAAFAELTVLAPSGARRGATRRSRSARRSARDGLRAAPRGPRRARAADRRDRAAIDGVDLALWRPAPREGAIAGATGELRFAPGGDVRDERGGRWSVDGELDVLDARVEDGILRSHAYPDALARAWSALTCPTSGDVLLSADARLRVRRLGRRRPRRRRQPRLAAPRRLARGAGLLRRRRAARPRRVVDRRRRADGPRALRRLSGCGDRTPWSTRRRGRAVAP